MPYRVYADRQAYNAKIKCEIIDILIKLPEFSAENPRSIKCLIIFPSNKTEAEVIIRVIKTTKIDFL